MTLNEPRLHIESLSISKAGLDLFQVELEYAVPRPRVAEDDDISFASDAEWDAAARMSLRIQLHTLPATTLSQWQQWLALWLMEQAQAFKEEPALQH
ncbi:hypothetical protein [Asaia astilbis]|uniref:hypothetical protein n=1 Tax=Asaia astilbis TaxID=610244 RepID=UPI00046F8D9F|nr:hypothetical protein [Asaia astilbis]